MTLQQLEYVIALDNYKNFVKAAKSIFVTQPTLTMQLKKLEDEVGFQIFDRSKKPLTPSHLGLQFIRKTRQILREVNELKVMVSNEIESTMGEYKIGIIPTLAPYLLPLFLPDFISNHKETKLHIEEMQSEAIISALKNDIIHIGILATPVQEIQLREIPVFNEAFLGLFPKNHPLLKKKEVITGDLEFDQLLLLSEGHCFRSQAINLCHSEEYKSNKAFNYESGSIETLKKLVEKGVGYTLVPELSVRDELGKNPYLKRFSHPEPSREVSLVVHKSFSKEKLIEILRQAILDNIPEGFNKNERFFRVKWR
ncbi:MAG: LysR family transcriptional regulator [Bacteroidales bacterium]|nr:LysR family transcriptional regulator [Bacteroidales bacterium]MCF8398892.1 LysR family transcriptional regulator [Bacteroidales bacterium]